MVLSAWKLFGTLVTELLDTQPQTILEKELILLHDTALLNQPSFLKENGFTLLRADNQSDQVRLYTLISLYHKLK